MEPPADAQPLPPVLSLTHNDLFNRMETSPRLHLKEDKLVPTWRYALARNGLWLWDTIWAVARGVELERAAPLALPAHVVRERHVENVRDAARADDVVVVEQVARLGVRGDGHVLLGARERPAAGDGAEERAEARAVERVAQREEVREEGALCVGKERERGEVARLLDLRSAPGSIFTSQIACNRTENGRGTPCKCPSPSRRS